MTHAAKQQIWGLPFHFHHADGHWTPKSVCEIVVDYHSVSGGKSNRISSLPLLMQEIQMAGIQICDRNKPFFYPVGIGRVEKSSLNLERLKNEWLNQVWWSLNMRALRERCDSQTCRVVRKKIKRQKTLQSNNGISLLPVLLFISISVLPRVQWVSQTDVPTLHSAWIWQN